MATITKLSQEELSAIKTASIQHVWSENAKRKKKIENIISKSADKVRAQAMIDCIEGDKELLEYYNDLVNIVDDYYKLKDIITKPLEVDNGRV